MTLSDEDVRFLAIELLTAPTDRDLQRSIGVSNLANQCDYCLACAFMNISRETPITDRAWGGRVFGTALHSTLEWRMNDAIQHNIRDMAARFPGALVEYKMALGILGTYGHVGSTSDLVLPSERHAFDWKGSTAAKLAVLADYLAISRGESAPYGRTHKVHKAKTLSEKVYAEELSKAETKITGYYAQLQGYGLGLNRSGIPVTRLSIVFIARDLTMWFDNPAADRYDDPTATHGVVVLSFDYDEAYAEAVWARGEEIWAGLESGKTVSDFQSHDDCFPCGLDGGNARAVDTSLPASAK